MIKETLIFITMILLAITMPFITQRITKTNYTKTTLILIAAATIIILSITITITRAITMT